MRLTRSLVLTASLIPTAMQAEHLARASAEMHAPRALGEGQSIPRWTGGALVSFRQNTYAADPSQPNVEVFDEKGARVTSALVWPSDAVQVKLKGATAGEDGRLAVFGVALTSRGARSSFVAEVLRSGDVRRYISTSPFQAEDAAFGRDGTLWLLGQQLPDDGATVAAAEHFVVQQLDKSGKVIRSLLPRSSFSASGHYHPAEHTALGLPRVLVRSGEIGVYSPTASEWIEFGTNGQDVNRWSVDALAGIERDGVTETGRPQKLTGIVMTEAGTVYASFQGGPGSALYRLVKSGAKASWLPVDTRDVPDFAWLLGSYGDALVYARPGATVARSNVGL